MPPNPQTDDNLQPNPYPLGYPYDSYTLNRTSTPIPDHYVTPISSYSNHSLTHPNPRSSALTTHSAYSHHSLPPHLAPISNKTPSIASNSSEEFYIDPRWDDMVTFRQLKIPYRASSFSTATSMMDLDETSSLFGRSVSPVEFGVPASRWASFLFRCTNSMISRSLVLVLFPVLVVSIWCAVPLQVIELDPSPTDPNVPPKYHMQFWFFLIFYYGFYNLTALLMVTQYFNLYSFYWWPKSIGGIGSTLFFWLLSMTLGSGIFYLTPFYKSIYSWVILTFITLMMPLCSAFLIIRHENRNVYRHSLSEAQKLFLLMQDNRVPYSYRRFLWFCVTLVIKYSALILGETYAKNFTQSPNKTWLDGIIYVYTWVITVFILDFICDYIAENKIRSWALSHVFRVYFALIYFIFYRNLFIKLRSADQFYTVQMCSSVWVIINYPLRMSKMAYNVTKFFGSKRKYDDYCKNVGRSFFIRNLAENVSMVGFLCWLNIIHFGPNSRVYPHFKNFDPIGADPTLPQYPMTMSASVGVWACEILSAYLTRLLFKKVFDRSITREAVIDFYKYPEVIWAMILVTIHVLQDMLLALIDLDSLK